MSDSHSHNDSIFNVEEAARRVGCSRHAIYSAIRRGELKAATINKGGHYRIRDEWLQAWINARSICVNEGVGR